MDAADEVSEETEGCSTNLILEAYQGYKLTRDDFDLVLNIYSSKFFPLTKDVIVSYMNLKRRLIEIDNMVI